MSDTPSYPPIALALSGGGVRAMVFHLGVLKRLAEDGMLESVEHISSVSGGSLLTGMIFAHNNMTWPTSKEYLEQVLPAIRKDLQSKHMLKAMFLELIKPKNWRFVVSRANLLARVLEKQFGIHQMLSEIPGSPKWSINGTTAESGKRFRFKQKNMGDYVVGYADVISFPLSEAMAISAGFPGGIGPLVLETNKYVWKRRENWGDDISKSKVIAPTFKKLHLYDGGVYDNLGLEPFFDPGCGIRKEKLSKETMIIASDAGAPLKQGFNKSCFNVLRLKRIISDVIHDQARALRVRTFHNFIKRDKSQGHYFYIGESVSNPDFEKDAEFSRNFPTSLSNLGEHEFQSIFNHGYRVADMSFSA